MFVLVGLLPAHKSDTLCTSCMFPFLLMLTVGGWVLVLVCVGVGMIMNGELSFFFCSTFFCFCQLWHVWNQVCGLLQMGCGVDQVSTYRAKNNKCRSFPRALLLHTYTRAWLTTGDVHYPPAVCKTKLNAFASMLPDCTVHCTKDNFNCIALVWNCMKLNGCRFWGGPMVFQRLERFNFTTSKPPTSIPWYAAFYISTFWCGVTCVLKTCGSHILTSPFLTRATRVLWGIESQITQHRLSLQCSKPVITFVFKVLRNGLLRCRLYTCPNVW